MAKFRKKPVVIEAVQFTGDNWAEMHAFTGHRNVETEEKPHYVDAFNPIGTYIVNDEFAWGMNYAAEIWVETNRANLPIVVGDWVLKDKLGFSPCKDSVFQETYEPVEDV